MVPRRSCLGAVAVLSPPEDASHHSGYPWSYTPPGNWVLGHEALAVQYTCPSWVAVWLLRRGPLGRDPLDCPLGYEEQTCHCTSRRSPSLFVLFGASFHAIVLGLTSATSCLYLQG